MLLVLLESQSFITADKIHLNYKNIGGFNGDVYVELFKNPSHKERLDIDSGDDLRGIYHHGDIYLWRGDVLHQNVIKKFGNSIPQLKKGVPIIITTNGDFKTYKKYAEKLDLLWGIPYGYKFAGILE